MFRYFRLSGVLLALALGVASLKEGKPVFDPSVYFNGRTHSWGIIESRGGEPSQVLTTQTQGQWEGDTFRFEQDLAFEKKEGQHRSWRIRRLDAHHFTATGMAIVGEARGRLTEMFSTWNLRSISRRGNPLLRIHMSQWMYLQPDGRTMINRDVLTKGGVVVAQYHGAIRQKPLRVRKSRSRRATS
jgi:Protein of unknown function (DUF3833)